MRRKINNGATLSDFQMNLMFMIHFQPGIKAGTIADISRRIKNKNIGRSVILSGLNILVGKKLIKYSPKEGGYLTQQGITTISLAISQ